MNTIAYRVQYTFTPVHARIPNGQPREDPREEKRAASVSVESADKSARIVVRVRLVASWTGKSPDTPTSVRGSEVGEDVRVGVAVRVGTMEFMLNQSVCLLVCWSARISQRPHVQI